MTKKRSSLPILFVMLLFATSIFGQDIHKAAQNGDLEAVKSILERDPGQIEALNANKSTPLIVAASQGHIRVIAFLLDKGADIQAVNAWGGTALLAAIVGGHSEAANLLIEKGADVNTPSRFGPPLHLAVNRGNVDIIQKLIGAGADIDAVNASSGWTALHMAAVAGRYEAAKVLVENGIDLNILDKRGAAALHYALLSSTRDAAKVALLLLNHGAEFNTAMIDGNTPLLIAVKAGKEDAVKLLLEKGADTGSKDRATQRTMLHFAAVHGYGNIAALLIKHGIDIHARDKYGRTALDYAEIHGNKKVADGILAAGGKSGDAEKNFGRSRYLDEPLANGEAYIWKLASFGWAVKTKDHLLVFNNEEHSKEPDEPLLANGFISAAEMADQNIFAVYPAYHADAYAKEFIHAIEDSLKNITYIHYKNDKLQGNTNTVYLGGEGKIVIQDTSFAYAEEKNEDGMGWLNYLIESDGFTFYYSGFLAAPLEINKKHLENMAKGSRSCDVAFLLLSARRENTGYIDQVIAILKPKEVFLHMALNTPDEETIATLQKKYPAVKFRLARDPGERFHYKTN
jgi:ankyrin repeat protein